MSNIITQELITEIREIVHPKTVFKLSIWSSKFEYSTNLENLVEYAWSIHCGSSYYQYHLDKISFVKDLTEKRCVSFQLKDRWHRAYEIYSIPLIQPC